MGIGAFAEPLVVVTLLFGGTWINRNTSYRMFGGQSQRYVRIQASMSDDEEEGLSSPASYDSLLSQSEALRSGSPTLLPQQEPKWRKRQLKLLGYRKDVTSPNTRVFKQRVLSRLLQKFPFLVEAWYWALIYWVYQLGRAFTAVTLVEGTVHVARRHALQLIHLEQKLHIFWELPIQHAFMKHPDLMIWINRIYSFIHIPATIFFLVWLYYYTTTRNRINEFQADKNIGEIAGNPAGPALYRARRRTMAVCNLIAFVVFTAWPCMPPRLLSDKNVTGPSGKEARSYGFVDTVHGDPGNSSVWTTNRFCNQYAAMPSLHFGYSLLIGLTIMTVPLKTSHRKPLSISLPFMRIRLPSIRRLACLSIGFTYPLIILIAIISTANHFILDAVAGAMVCWAAWNGNKILLNLLWLEDWFLWCVRIHKPEINAIDMTMDPESDSDDETWGKAVH